MRVSGRNILLVLVGAALVVASMHGLRWYDVDPGRNVAGTSFTFDDLRSNADALDAAVSQAYFDWLAVVLLVIGGVAGIGACVASPLSRGLRLVAFTAGVLGVLGTVYAMAQLFDAQRAAGGSEHGLLHNASYGLWAALVGYAFVLLGGALGPPRSGARRS